MKMGGGPEGCCEVTALLWQGKENMVHVNSLEVKTFPHAFYSPRPSGAGTGAE